MRVFSACLVLATSAALAQSPPTTSTPTAPKADEAQSAACAQANTQATVGQGGDVKVPTPEGKPLGEKLAQSNGVICPPDKVDPQIHAPTPDRGKMPVIPPPGMPGSSNQSTRPK
jgi:hypothetical protein